MMMKALGAGGMDLEFDPARDEMNDQWGDESYRPNEGGFYELDSETYRRPDFPLPFKGKLIKGLFGALGRLPVHGYRIVIMLRDPEEIRQSYEAFFSKTCPLISGEPFSADSYWKAAGWWISQMKNRRDVELAVLNYRDVVLSPISAFSLLTAKGWPIDPGKAARIVNPDLCRFKKEELVPGL